MMHLANRTIAFLEDQDVAVQLHSARSSHRLRGGLQRFLLGSRVKREKSMGSMGAFVGVSECNGMGIYQKGFGVYEQ
jgi:hypothetical protein